MSDYMFMLENHLSADQNRVITEVQAAAAQANLSVFLTGGAMRDMLGGLQIRDLDFSVEGNALRLAKAVSEKAHAPVLEVDEHRRSSELLFPGGVTAQIAMARQERYTKPGARPQIHPATIQEDLRGRDFTVNAIALSLNRASRGLLLDPMNGLADLGRRELRTVSAYSFYDDPSRLLRFIRFQIRLGFSVEERTRMQYENARAAELESHIAPGALLKELKHIAEEQSPGEILRALQRERLLPIFSPALTGTKLDFASLAKLDKVTRLVPSQNGTGSERLGPFLYALAEKLTAKERAALIKKTGMQKPDIDLWQKLEPRAKKLEAALKSARLRKPSQIYHVLHKAGTDELIFLLQHSTHKPVQERIRNYLQKYIPLIQEITPAELESIGVEPGTPKYQKAKEAFIAARLDRRPKKHAAAPLAVPIEAMAPGRGRPADPR